MKQFKIFNKLEYKRVDYTDTEKTVATLIEKLKNAQNFNEFLRCFNAISTVGALVIAESCKDNLDVFKNTASVASYFSINDLSNYNLPDPFKSENISKLAKKLKNSLQNYYKDIKE